MFPNSKNQFAMINIQNISILFESIGLIVMEVIGVILFQNDLNCEHLSSCYKYLILIKICINGLNICIIHNINYKSIPFPIYSNIVIYFTIFDIYLECKVNELSSCNAILKYSYYNVLNF